MPLSSYVPLLSQLFVMLLALRLLRMLLSLSIRLGPSLMFISGAIRSSLGGVGCSAESLGLEKEPSKYSSVAWVMEDFLLFVR